MKKCLVPLAVIAALAISGCQMRGNARNMATLTVDFSWSMENKCSPVPPAIEISGIPEGTAFLEIIMTDLDGPPYPHGFGVVEYKGSGDVPEGSFSFYKGPCPPGGTIHNYEIRVEAINAADDTILASGRAVRAFPPE